MAAVAVDEQIERALRSPSTSMTPAPSSSPATKSGVETNREEATKAAATSSPALDPVRNNKATLEQGSVGLTNGVVAMQRDLAEYFKKKGISIEVPQSGNFDAATAAALKEFQKREKLIDTNAKEVPLAVDGIFGPRSARALDLALGRPVMDAKQFDVVIGGQWRTSGYLMQSFVRQPSLTEGPEIRLSPERAGHPQQLGSGNTITFEEALNLKPTIGMLRLAQTAASNTEPRSIGYCQRYVRLALERNGLGFEGPNPPRAVDAPNVLANDPRYTEVVGVPPSRLKDLPPGAIVYYTHPTDDPSALRNPAAAAKPGHAMISLGNGKFASDFVHSANVFRGRGIQAARVFIPHLS